MATLTRPSKRGGIKVGNIKPGVSGLREESKVAGSPPSPQGSPKEMKQKWLHHACHIGGPISARGGGGAKVAKPPPPHVLLAANFC